MPDEPKQSGDRLRPGTIAGKETPEGVVYTNGVLGAHTPKPRPRFVQYANVNPSSGSTAVPSLDAEMLRDARIPPTVAADADDVRPDHII